MEGFFKTLFCIFWNFPYYGSRHYPFAKNTKVLIEVIPFGGSIDNR